MFGAVKGQEASRRYEEFRDQHGRIWGANVEIKTGDPCEVLTPVGWQAPTAPSWFAGKLTPPPDHVKMVPSKYRARKGYQVEVDYVGWIEAVDKRTEEHQQKLADIAQGMAKGGDVLALIENPSPALLQFVGPAPFPPRAFIQAAQAGNAWATGDEDAVVPHKATPILSELQPVVMAKRHRSSGTFDPLAEDGEEETRAFAGAIATVSTDPLDDLLDLEEHYDPNASGGKKAPVRRPKRATV